MLDQDQRTVGRWEARAASTRAPTPLCSDAPARTHPPSWLRHVCIGATSALLALVWKMISSAF